MTDVANPQITDADLQALLTQNPLAAEQLRRIMAERQRDEALAALAIAQNGTAPESDVEEVVSADIGIADIAGPLRPRG